MVEQKYHLERNQERERNEHLESQRNLEEKLKELQDKYQKDQVEQQMRFDKLKQTHTILQSEHKHLADETQKANKEQLDNINGLEKKLQSVKSELQKEKSNKSGELVEWRVRIVLLTSSAKFNPFCFFINFELFKEKYNIVEKDYKRLLTDTQQLHAQIKTLEETIKDYHSHCEYKVLDNFRKSVAPKPDISNLSTSEKSFNHQDLVSEGVYHISVNISNNNNKENKNLNGNGVSISNDTSNAHVGVKDKLSPQQTTKISQPPLDTNNDIKPLTIKHFNGSLILNSVENFQIVPKIIKTIEGDEEQEQQEKPNRQLSLESDKNQIAPLSAPKNRGQLTSSAIPKSEKQVQAALAFNATSANVRTIRGSSTISSNSPPLALPPSQRKLPENVAPIPENFDDFFPKSNNENPKNNNQPSLLDKNHNHDLNNKPAKLALNNNNYDSGGHEIKDVLAEGDSNIVQHDDDVNNFFDNDPEPKERSKNKGGNDEKEDDVGNDDDDGGLGADDGGGNILGGAAAGDIAVKHNQQQLLDESLRNEIADDQGKEFGDGLRLDEGAMEEDDDG